MLRLLLFVVLGYFILRIIQIVARAISTANRGNQRDTSPPAKEKPAQTFNDVKDAEFVELPPDEKK